MKPHHKFHSSGVIFHFLGQVTESSMDWSGEVEMPGSAGLGVFNNTTLFDAEDNLTLSCAAESIQGPVELPYPETLVMVVRILQCILSLLVFVVGCGLNILVVILVAKYKKLQTLSFGIALQIVALDLVLAFMYGFSLPNSIANRWLFGEHVCSLIGVIVLVIVLVRTAVLCIFVIDRFLLVFFPFSYPKHQIVTVVALSALAWLFSLAVAVVGYFLDCYTFIANNWWCFLNVGCNRNCSALQTAVHLVLTAPCIIVPIVLYTLLFMKAKKAKAAMTSAAAGMDGPKLANDWKATITFFLMFLTVFVLTLPNLVIVFVLRVQYDKVEMPLVLYLLSVAATRLLSLLPISDAVLILRNGDVREVVREILEKMVQKCRPNAGN